MRTIHFIGVAVCSLLFVGAGCQQDSTATESVALVDGAQPLPPIGQQEHPPTGAIGEGGMPPAPVGNMNEFNIAENETSYAVYTESDGELSSLQPASLFLSSKGYNETGGALLFNHPGAVASDGQRLFLADRNNNRILVWNSLPSDNQEPDFVLGQDNFNTNNPGAELNQMNWPISIAVGGGKLFVSDTYNDRILVWNEMPTESGASADFAIETEQIGRGEDGSLIWPWDIWTDGEKLVVTSTQAAQVLIWNSIPTSGDQLADITLRNESFGTPRSIGSDGTVLAISDHNANGGTPGTFFWSSFPTSGDQAPDFFVESPSRMGEDTPELGNSTESHGNGELTWMTMSDDGALWMLAGSSLYQWDSFPTSATDAADNVYGQETGYGFKAGDGSGLALAGEKLYLSLSNGNKIVYYDTAPTDGEGTPDGVIGSPDLNTNTLDTNYIMSNPVPATDGTGLIVGSDFDHKLYVWKQVPDEVADPDYVYTLPEAPWDNSWYEDVFVAGGKNTIYVWADGLPTEGAEPSQTYSREIGSVQFNEIKGIAYNGDYLFVSDVRSNAVYVWEGLPDENDEPVATINFEQPQRLSASSDYLMVSTVYGQEPIRLMTIEQALAGETGTAVTGERYNLPEGVYVGNDGKVAVGDTAFNRVQVWNSVDSALSGAEADVTLGTEEEQTSPMIGESTLFWPSGITMYNNTLWVGEFKFSERLLRFNP